VSARPSILLDLEPHLFYFILVVISIFAIELLVLLVLRLLAGRVPWWPGVALHKIATAIGGGVLIAKAQQSCSQAVNVVSFINRIIPRLSSKDQEQTLMGSHQLVSKQDYSVREFQSFIVFNFLLCRKAKNNFSRLVCLQSYRPFEPFTSIA
jgi:hypothetical protein